MRDVTMRTGLIKSLNVVTVDVALRTGLSRIAELASSFGLPKPQAYPALALGTAEATPLEMAQAYAAFANGGQRVSPQVIAHNVEASAHEVFNDEVQPGGVIRPTTAFMITDMLAGVIEHGTARAARGAVKRTAIAGKTGTSRDGWFVGYTPNLVCAVWIGFDDNSQLGLTGAEAALPAWTEFVKSAVELRPELGGERFERPAGIMFVDIDPDTGMYATDACPARERIAITGALAPHFECYAHNQDPALTAEAEERVPAYQIYENSREVNARPLPRAAEVEPIELQSGRTHVEIDRSGRATLVNDMHVNPQKNSSP